jgi:hypothetical protein
MKQIQTNNKNQTDLDQHFIYKMHKHHLIVKIVEIALFVSLFVFSAALAMAAPVTSDNVENLVNQERTSRGLAALKINYSLDNAAQKKSSDMIKRNYFDHYAYGLSPWVFIQNENYDYLYAGENLAMDFNTAEGMVNAWMASPSHRKNILNPDFNEMGVGVVKGEFSDTAGQRETTMVTNMFASPKPAVIRIFDSVVEKIKNIF